MLFDAAGTARRASYVDAMNRCVVALPTLLEPLLGLPCVSKTHSTATALPGKAHNVSPEHFTRFMFSPAEVPLWPNSEHFTGWASQYPWLVICPICGQPESTISSVAYILDFENNRAPSEPAYPRSCFGDNAHAIIRACSCALTTQTHSPGMSFNHISLLTVTDLWSRVAHSPLPLPRPSLPAQPSTPHRSPVSAP